MTGKTHTLGGSAFALSSYIILTETGLVHTNLDPAAQLLCILPWAVWASKVPDLDQEKESVALQTPVNLVIQKFFNLVQAGHRSFRSHVYPAVVFAILALISVSGINLFNVRYTNSLSVYCMVLLGIAMGLISHALLDLCTTDGLHHKSKRYAFVPKIKTFETGSFYEDCVRGALYVLNIILFILLFFL